MAVHYNCIGTKKKWQIVPRVILSLKIYTCMYTKQGLLKKKCWQVKFLIDAVAFKIWQFELHFWMTMILKFSKFLSVYYNDTVEPLLTDSSLNKHQVTFPATHQQSTFLSCNSWTPVEEDNFWSQGHDPIARGISWQEVIYSVDMYNVHLHIQPWSWTLFSQSQKVFLTINRCRDAMLSCFCLDNRAQMTSTRGKNKKVAHKLLGKCVTKVLTTFWHLL